MRVLVIGNGAREHALALFLSRDPAVTALTVAPGNAGTLQVAQNRPVDVLDPSAVAALAVELAADLVVVGPEAPLVAGVADRVRAAGIAVFGPSAAAAQIEGSKSFAKDVMRAAGVPTAAADTCSTADEAVAALGARPGPWVVKADGLAAGKGVLVTEDLVQAELFARDVLASAGAVVVVEDFLDGPEVSLFVLTDGQAAVPLLPAQDHKRVFDGDEGPNTGGMGAYAPLPWLPDGTVERVMATVVEPVLEELVRRGTPFSGVLYVGLAMTRTGPQVVEFNCRFGDPDSQPVLALLETPLAGLLLACSAGALAAQPPLAWAAGAAVNVVLAAEGYPGSPVAGDVVTVGELPLGATLLHAGTRSTQDGAVTAGGRVLSVVAVAPTLGDARDLAYTGLRQVGFRGAHHRTDIAARAVRGEITVPDERGATSA